jgi:hypothetical protein
MRYSHGETRYDAIGESKCWEMFHPELRNGPHCGEDLDHQGDHRGNNLTWAAEPQTDADTAQRFLDAYRRIPNGTEGITLNDDGTATLTIRALEAAVRFIRVVYSD